jgi:hypothetical protein
MDTVYRFRFTDEHLITSHLRYRQQVWWRRPFFVFKWLIAALAAMLLGVAAMAGSVVLGGIFGAILGVLLLGWPIDRWFMRNSFQKSPFRNSDITFSLSREGAHVVGTNEEVRVGWPIYTKARRFKDGLLLFQGPHVFNWLPDSALVEGAGLERAIEFVRGNVKDYRDV